MQLCVKFFERQLDDEPLGMHLLLESRTMCMHDHEIKTLIYKIFPS